MPVRCAVMVVLVGHQADRFHTYAEARPLRERPAKLGAAGAPRETVPAPWEALF